MLVLAPARKATSVMRSTSLACSEAARALRRRASVRRMARLPDAHLAERPAAGRRRLRRARCRGRPAARGAAPCAAPPSQMGTDAEHREAPAPARREQPGRREQLRREQRGHRRQVLAPAVVDHALGRRHPRGDETDVGLGSRSRHAWPASRQSLGSARVRRQRELRVGRRVDRAVRRDEHAQRFLRAPHRQLRLLHARLVRSTLPVARAARSAGCRDRCRSASRRTRSAPRALSRARSLSSTTWRSAEDGQVRLGRGDGDHPPRVVRGAIRHRDLVRTPGCAAPTGRDSTSGAASREPTCSAACGARWTAPPNSGTGPIDGGRDRRAKRRAATRARVCCSSASARRMPAAACCTLGFALDGAAHGLVQRDLGFEVWAWAATSGRTTSRRPPGSRLRAVDGRRRRNPLTHRAASSSPGALAASPAPTGRRHTERG